MHFAKAALHAATFLLLGAQHVFANTIFTSTFPGKVILINATPYDWKQVATHQHLMEWKFLDVIPAGTTLEQNFKFHDPNDAGETTFTLVGYPTAASFVVQARRQSNNIQIVYQNNLSSLNNPQDSFIDLGFVQDGSVLFILAGNGTDGSPFISSNPPVAWMQSTLSNIGSKTLREIAMPGSHNSGMSQLTLWDGGVPHNSQTQSGSVYRQLVYGARFFDIRPVLSRGKFYTGHYSKLLKSQAGASGRTINDIVKDINRFTSDHPGELIILDLSHDMNRDKNYRILAPAEWQNLFGILKGINDLWVGSSSAPDDLSTLPISTFITPGSKSAVLIRIPEDVSLPGHEFVQFSRKSQRDLEATDNLDASPAASSDSDDDSESSSIDPASTPTPTIAPGFYYPAEAFVHATRLPHQGSYSNTDNANYLAKDQLSKLVSLRPGTKYPPLRSTWTITQRIAHILDITIPATSIVREASAAHSVLFRFLWNECSKSTYPNIIEVDNIDNSQIAALAMGINEYFADGGIDMPKVSDTSGLVSRSRLFFSELSCLPSWGCPKTIPKPKPAIVSRDIPTSTDHALETRKQSWWSKALCYINIPVGCNGKDENWNPYDAVKHRLERPSNVSLPDASCLLWFKMPEWCFPSTQAEIDAHDKAVKLEEQKQEAEEYTQNEAYRKAWFKEFNKIKNETRGLGSNISATNTTTGVEVQIQSEPHPKSKWGPRPDVDVMPWILNTTSAPAPSITKDLKSFPKYNNATNSTISSNTTTGAAHNEGVREKKSSSPKGIVLKTLQKLGCYAGSVTLGFFTNGFFRIQCEAQYQYHGP